MITVNAMGDNCPISGYQDKKSNGCTYRTGDNRSIS